MTLDELRALPVEYVGGHTEKHRAVRWYRNDKHGITMLVVTLRTDPDAEYGGWGVGKTYYLMDGSKRRYTLLETFLRAYNKRQK
jgi:hypothetical protein